MKKYALTAIGVCALLLGGCGSHTLTIAHAGWQSISIDGKVVEKIYCNYDDGTIAASGFVNYAGKAKPLDLRHVSVQCNQETKQLETTFTTKAN